MIVLYHANCNDGFCAAWVLSKHPDYKDATFIPVQYGQNPPDVSGEDVVIVDFSYKRDVLLKMEESAKSLLVLDHHKTAQQELEGLDFCRFDMSKSGARLAAELIGFKHWLVDYVEDRDLWKWKLTGSKEINAGISLFPHTFEDWDVLSKRTPSSVAYDGKVILLYQEQVIEQHLKRAKEVTFDGHKVMIVNATTLFSDIAGRLAKDRPFGVCAFLREDGKLQFSLRSTDEGLDVSEIARAYGGGGHRNAAGFELYRMDDRMIRLFT